MNIFVRFLTLTYTHLLHFPQMCAQEHNGKIIKCVSDLSMSRQTVFRSDGTRPISRRQELRVATALTEVVSPSRNEHVLLAYVSAEYAKKKRLKMSKRKINFPVGFHYLSSLYRRKNLEFCKIPGVLVQKLQKYLN